MPLARGIRFSFAGCALAFLASCAALGGGTPALDTYELTTPDVTPKQAGGGTQILIAEPDALKALDSQNIVIKTGQGTIQYLKGAQWADRLPNVVQARLADAFQKGGGFAGVGTPGQGLAIDYQVITEIRAFEVRVGGSSQAEVTLFVRLLNDRNGTVRAAKVFSGSAPVSGSGNEAYFHALDAAFEQVAVEIVDWADGLI